MSFLRDFAGAFATNIGNDMQAREDEERKLRLEAELEARRELRLQQAEVRRRRMSNEDRSTELNMQGPQIGVDDDGRQSLLRVRSSVDPESGALLAERERVADAPVTPVGRPMTIYDGPNRRSVQRYSDGSERDLGAPSPVRAAQGGGSGGGSAKVRTVTNSDGSKTDFDPETGKELRHYPAIGGGRGKNEKRETPDEVRKAWDDEISRASELTGRALQSKAKQYGVSFPEQKVDVGAPLPVDAGARDEALRTALLEKIDAQYGGRIESAGKQRRVPDTNDEKAPSPAEVLAEARKAIDDGRDPAKVKAKVARLLGIDPEDVNL